MSRLGAPTIDIVLDRYIVSCNVKQVKMFEWFSIVMDTNEYY